MTDVSDSNDGKCSSGLGLLSTRLRDIRERHRSLHALFDQSCELLSEPEQHSLMRLAVFHGGFDSAAAAAVADADLLTILALVDKPLVRADGSGRYDLHALVRHYAASRFALVRQSEDQEQASVAESWQN